MSAPFKVSKTKLLEALNTCHSIDMAAGYLGVTGACLRQNAKRHTDPRVKVAYEACLERSYRKDYATGKKHAFS